MAGTLTHDSKSKKAGRRGKRDGRLVNTC